MNSYFYSEYSVLLSNYFIHFCYYYFALNQNVVVQ